MMGKALELIEAAKDYEDVKIQGKPYRKKNPFGKPWGLQTDGDLWEQAWIAVLKRGAQNQKMRKVKGHATAADVAKGIATQQGKEGNDGHGPIGKGVRAHGP